MTSNLILIITAALAANNVADNNTNDYLKMDKDTDKISYAQSNNQATHIFKEYAMREEDVLFENLINKNKQQHMHIPQDTTKNNKYSNKAKPHLTRMQYK